MFAVYLTLGAASFLILGFAEWLSCRNARLPRWPGLVLATLLIGYATAGLLTTEGSLLLPLVARIVGGILALPFMALLVFSLFLELSGTSAYGGASPALVATGTYALVRHPGVLWLFGLHGFLALTADSLPLLAALPIWTIFNILLVSLEDKYIFPRLFGDSYRRYQRQVPFLIPNAASFGRSRADLAARFAARGRPNENQDQP